RDVSFRLGVAKTPPELLLRPQVSILYGSFYLAWLMQEFHGRVHEVLAAYHTDPIMAKEWSKQFGNASFDPYVDKVPYLETQAYIRRVMDDYLIYKMIY
ncbi:MAG: lytic transglycosylase domain-containing protein, partial [Candidatus Margulisbacteria bacterium]|nr:lytic transglycosylase domain-containing protein [Candidatus Margulisiibacteriota bacterium]